MMSHDELISIGRRSDFFPMKIPQSRRPTQDDLAKFLTPCEKIQKIVSFSRRISLLFNILNKFTDNRQTGHGLRNPRNPQNAIKKLNLKASKIIKAHNSSSQLWFHYHTKTCQKSLLCMGKLNNKNFKKSTHNSNSSDHIQESHTQIRSIISRWSSAPTKSIRFRGLFVGCSVESIIDTNREVCGEERKHLMIGGAGWAAGIER